MDATKVGVDGVKAALQNLQLTDQTSLSTKFGALAASVGAVEQAAAPILNGARAGCPA